MNRLAAAVVTTEALRQLLGEPTRNFLLEESLRDALSRRFGREARSFDFLGIMANLRTILGYGGITAEGVTKILSVEDLVQYVSTLGPR